MNSFNAKPDFLSVSTKLPIPFDLLSSAFNFSLNLSQRPLGLYGYSNSFNILRDSLGGSCQCGLFAYSSPSSQDSRVFNSGSFVSLSGLGCLGLDVRRFISFLLPYQPSITRLDIAIDYLDGELTYDDIVQHYRNGLFHVRGTMPRAIEYAPKRSSLDGGSTQKAGGYTFYVGLGGSKAVRAYEKTFEQIETGNLDTLYLRWFRFEVELKARDFDIPLNFFENYDSFLNALYPKLIPHLPIPLSAGDSPSSNENVKPFYKLPQFLVSVEHLKKHARRSYGGLLHVLREHLGMSKEEIFDVLERAVIPSRLDLPLLKGN